MAHKWPLISLESLTHEQRTPSGICDANLNTGLPLCCLLLPSCLGEKSHSFTEEGSTALKATNTDHVSQIPEWQPLLKSLSDDLRASFFNPKQRDCAFCFLRCSQDYLPQWPSRNHHDWAKPSTPCFTNPLTHLFLFGGLVHFGLQKIDEFGLLGNSAFHFHLLMRIENLRFMKTKSTSDA